MHTPHRLASRHTALAQLLLASEHVDVCVVGYGTMPNRHPPAGPVTASTPVTAINTDASGDLGTPAGAIAATKTRISLPPNSRPARAHRAGKLASTPLAAAGAATAFPASTPPPPPPPFAAAAPAAADVIVEPAAEGGSDVEYDVLDPAPYQPDLSRHTYPEGGAGLTAVTPLHLAAGLGNAAIVQALLAHPSAAAQLAHDHSLLSVFVLQTPLHLAVQAGAADTAARLLAAGHQVDVPSARLGHTALHRAAALGHVELVRLLLSYKVRHGRVCY